MKVKNKKKNQTMQRLGVVGVGYVGLVTAAVFAELGKPDTVEFQQIRNMFLEILAE